MVAPRANEDRSVDPDASVIVCTKNRAALLKDALAAILSDASSVSRELIVVDNGSSDGTEAVVRALTHSGAVSAVRYMSEPRPGKANALNLAVAGARGKYLLFTDDDALVQDGWAGALVDGFADGDVAVVGGRTLPQWPHPPPDWLSPELAGVLAVRDLGTEPRALDPTDVVGANMAMRIDLLRGLVSAFEPLLGPRGQLKMDYEEFDLVTRLKEGHSIAYAPGAVVLHRIAEGRMEWDWHRRTWFQKGFGFARYERLRGHPGPTFARRAVRAVRHYAAAIMTRRQNARRRVQSADDAQREFSRYYVAGRSIQLLLGRFPGLAEWAAASLP